jgi:hypothetical protein
MHIYALTGNNDFAMVKSLDDLAVNRPEHMLAKTRASISFSEIDALFISPCADKRRAAPIFLSGSDNDVP